MGNSQRTDTWKWTYGTSGGLMKTCLTEFMLKRNFSERKVSLFNHYKKQY